MSDFKNIITNWAALLVCVTYALWVYFTNIVAGQTFNWLTLVGVIVTAVISYLTGKSPSGKAYTQEQLKSLPQ